MRLALQPRKLRVGLSLLRWRQAAIRAFLCPLCGPSVLLKLDNHELAVRCVRCGATPISMSLGLVVKALVPNLRHARVCELSARGAFFDFLRRRADTVVGSEYIEGVPSGTTVDGVRIEDVEHLSFAEQSFELCTSTEVFEHVADDRRAFPEMHRVLKPAGVLLFTVPIDLNGDTFDRAAVRSRDVIHLSPPEFHRDPARGSSPVLCFRNYGRDITDRLLEAGFSDAEVIVVDGASWFGHARPVILARKQNDNPTGVRPNISSIASG